MQVAQNNDEDHPSQDRLWVLNPGRSQFNGAEEHQ
jgi:hypothetical protein